MIEKGRPRLKKAIADAYSPFFGREINPNTEVTITTGANEGILCAFMGFVEPGDEVIVFEPFFDQCVNGPIRVHLKYLIYTGISRTYRCPAV